MANLGFSKRKDNLLVVTNKLGVHFLDAQSSADLRLKKGNVPRDIEFVLAAVAVQVSLEHLVGRGANELGQFGRGMAKLLVRHLRGRGIVRRKRGLEHLHQTLDHAKVTQEFLSLLGIGTIDKHKVVKFAERGGKPLCFQGQELTCSASLDVMAADRNHSHDIVNFKHRIVRNAGDDKGVIKELVWGYTGLAQSCAIPFNRIHLARKLGVSIGRVDAVVGASNNRIIGRMDPMT